MQAKKHFGQNFLTDKNKVNEIINSLGLDKDTKVIEVGPGMGALTYDIAERVKSIIAIEIDPDMVAILNESETLKVLESDVLEVDFKEMVKEETQFISNLPYYISSKILFKVLEHNLFTKVSVMMQKELVDRIYADYNNKEYGRLSVAIRSFFDVEKIIKVPRNCFTPAPNVESAFIILNRVDNNIEDRRAYLTFIKHSFAQKRKKWLNSLKNMNSAYYEKAKVWIEENGKSESIRAEQINVDEFIQMWKEFRK